MDRTCLADDALGELDCDSGVCVARSCEPGEAGCLCEPDYGCADETLICRDGRCEVIGCRPGDIGCVCLPGALCAEVGVTCVDGRCQEPAWTPGPTDG